MREEYRCAQPFASLGLARLARPFSRTPTARNLTRARALATTSQTVSPPPSPFGGESAVGEAADQPRRTRFDRARTRPRRPCREPGTSNSPIRSAPPQPDRRARPIARGRFAPRTRLVRQRRPTRHPHGQRQAYPAQAIAAALARRAKADNARRPAMRGFAPLVQLVQQPWVPSPPPDPRTSRPFFAAPTL